MQDTIVREITVKATQERVYTAMTDPKQVTKWFPDAVEGLLSVGERPIFNFGADGKVQTYIETAKPHNYFAFRWVPGNTSFTGDVLKVPNTLVEFFIEKVDGGTKVTIKESGFASLPAEVAEKSLNMNTGGWDYMVGRLEKLMNQS